ncbi:hypothetical protein VDGE_30516 [Verticillium dahliae]|uniref:Uncharacterized protein n=1 Tax=Verticillium dahliae TaxID=27337 RepID=A0A444RJ20_VERDA|nr:hypothetical protein VDGE_30516 [Verticillium dahliae]
MQFTIAAQVFLEIHHLMRMDVRYARNQATLRFARLDEDAKAFSIAHRSFGYGYLQEEDYQYINHLHKKAAILFSDHYNQVRREEGSVVTKQWQATLHPGHDAKADGWPKEQMAVSWLAQERGVHVGFAAEESRPYDADWNYFGSKRELAAPLSQITGISMSYLSGALHFRDACIATKMSWMAGRETTREEDMAYSMAGIFNVNMDAQYGEGRKAFMRLQHALIAKNDESLFAWKMPAGVADEQEYRSPIPTVELGPYEWGLLAASPSWFAGCGAMNTHSSRGVVRHRGGFTLTPQGISGPIGRREHYTAAILSGLTVVGMIPYHMWLKKREKTTLRYALNCWDESAPGTAKAVQVLLRPVSRNPAVFVRTECQTYELVDSVKNTSYSMVGTVMQPELY